MKLLLLSTALMIALGTATASAQEAETLPDHVTDYARSEAPDDHTVGSENAAITMIIWASVTCSHCSNWFMNEWPTVKTELIDTGILRFIFRELPTDPTFLSMTGFRIAECAPTENYMSVIEEQMKERDSIIAAARIKQSDQKYYEIAKLAGMETDEAIATCFRNPDITAHIIDNDHRAQVAEIKAVPAFLINGETYNGAKDAESLVALIKDMDEKGLSAIPENTPPADAHAGHEHK